MAKVIDQKAYLKKYLSSDDKLGKKKKKKSKDKTEKPAKSTVKIIDDDAYTYHEEIDESELYATNEEAPQIVGVIDERAADVIMKQEYIESGKWKAMKADSKKYKKNNAPARRKSPDESPPRKIKTKGSDESPPRKRRDLDQSPPRKQDSDASPPRRIKQNSPIRKRQNSDESPPRRSRRDSDASPPRKPRQLSPQTKRRGSDESPPRRTRKDSDASPPRKSRPNTSPRRRSRSPNYRKSRWADNVKKEKSPSPPPTHSKRITKTLDGKAAGLQNAQTLKRENEEYRARQDKAFREMKADVSGRNADVVIRDRRGRNKEFEYDAEKERKKMEAEEARKKEYEKWGKGLKQVEEAQRRRAEFEHEASKPIARAADDEDLQKHLKDQEWADDPMLQYMRRKKTEDKRSQGVLERPAYKGNFPDNRFNIRPGFRWDGVDRSNGYEKKYFEVISSKKSIEEEAYRYSTEDM